jgi:uncharacterized protein
MPIFAVELRFTDNDRRLEVRPAHREYLATLHASGRLVSAGPWADETGAMLLYDVADEGELRDVIDKDPYTPAEVVEITAVREWRPLFPFGSAST